MESFTQCLVYFLYDVLIHLIYAITMLNGDFSTPLRHRHINYDYMIVVSFGEKVSIGHESKTIFWPFFFIVLLGRRTTYDYVGALKSPFCDQVYVLHWSLQFFSCRRSYYVQVIHSLGLCPSGLIGFLA